MTSQTPVVGAAAGGGHRRPTAFAGAATLVAALALALVPRLGAPPTPAAVAVSVSVPTAARPHAAPEPLPTVPASVRRFAGRIPAQTRQLLVVQAASTRTTYGTVRRYVRTGGGWQLRNTWRARLGAGGMVKAARRVQGTNTTPMGRFTITEAFGRKADPGTAVPYRRVTNDDWWVQDRRSAYYNQRRLASQGGFRVTTYGRNGSEHLRSMGRQYDYVAVIDFNRPDPVIGRGSGIFLHVKNGHATAGCVSIPHRAMRKVLRWLDPSKAPMIVMGQRDWLRAAR